MEIPNHSRYIGFRDAIGRMTAGRSPLDSDAAKDVGQKLLPFSGFERDLKSFSRGKAPTIFGLPLVAFRDQVGRQRHQILAAHLKVSGSVR
jgi:hypothetical protein